jgi:hypothetical protein
VREVVDFDEKRELTTGRQGGYPSPGQDGVGIDFQEKRAGLILGQGVDSPDNRERNFRNYFGIWRQSPRLKNN